MLHKIVTPTGVEGQPSCYQRFPGPLNWTASRDDCAARDAALLTTRQQYMSDAGILTTVEWGLCGGVSWCVPALPGVPGHGTNSITVQSPCVACES
jgi:hypothetical protein